MRRLLCSLNVASWNSFNAAGERLVCYDAVYVVYVVVLAVVKALHIWIILGSYSHSSFTGDDCGFGATRKDVWGTAGTPVGGVATVLVGAATATVGGLPTATVGGLPTVGAVGAVGAVTVFVVGTESGVIGVTAAGEASSPADHSVVMSESDAGGARLDPTCSGGVSASSTGTVNVSSATPVDMSMSSSSYCLDSPATSLFIPTLECSSGSLGNSFSFLAQVLAMLRGGPPTF